MEMLKAKAKILEPALRIGKNGLTDNVFIEIEKLLKKRKLVKIKILNNCMQEPEELVEAVINKSRSTLVSHVGNVFTIYRPKS
jgi:RNA-binding protein